MLSVGNVGLLDQPGAKSRMLIPKVKKNQCRIPELPGFFDMLDGLFMLCVLSCLFLFLILVHLKE